MEPGTGSAGLAGLDRAALEAVIDALPTPMAIVEAGTGSVTFANRAAARLTGAPFPTGPPEERNTRGDYYAADAGGRRLSTEELPSARAGRGEPIENVELEWHTPAGWRSLLVNGARLPGGTTILSFDDVTALKQAELERRSSHALLDALFEGAPIGVAFLDRDLRYRRVNEKLAEINGLPVEAHLGRTVAELLPDMDPRGARSCAGCSRRASPSWTWSSSARRTRPAPLVTSPPRSTRCSTRPARPRVSAWWCSTSRSGGRPSSSACERTRASAPHARRPSWQRGGRA